MMSRKDRMEKLKKALQTDPCCPKNADEAHKFIKSNLDKIEVENLSSKYHDNYTIRMMIPPFKFSDPATPSEWCRKGPYRIWKAEKHLIKIWDKGDIEITSYNGKIFFEKNNVSTLCALCVKFIRRYVYKAHQLKP